MKISNNSLNELVWNFSQDYLQAYQHRFEHLPITHQVEDWPSPCEQGIHEEEFSLWHPIKLEETLTFNNVEAALEVTIHHDIKQYFTTMYSDSLDASCAEGDLSLLFAWSAEDFARLQENIIGHILMKTKLKQKLTIFFATTDDDNHIISLDNDTGEIWVEKVGCEPHKKIADTLVEFISQLAPRIPPKAIEE
ncbi:SecY-interacting protein [Colwellia sp. Arc7-D]|jgi:SecY interacting protein Syd|uniref:SecY-interacting protein n=1 Tax=Colwellia sp. Arc7-D TaxID=2161872 RepID=UPI000D33B673|nr:SecY-interacting protein [Colwellia sp. Arc7-D]AWB58087.1 SecY-interacting protein [Colwellia sp. Arc7-D]|tara:strand:- start:797 stop:1375 length:579 start_codon:yes stop_codon:yes gene_type:complete